MDTLFVKALLLGADAKGSSYLKWQLENRGCHCWFARSTKEAAATYQEHKFDLILSTLPLAKFDPLLVLLSSTTCKIFHCQLQDDSSWWTPVTLGEQKSSGPGMRPSEFLEMLDKMLSQRRMKAVSAPRPMPQTDPQVRAFKAAS